MIADCDIAMFSRLSAGILSFCLATSATILAAACAEVSKEKIVESTKISIVGKIEPEDVRRFEQIAMTITDDPKLITVMLSKVSKWRSH